MNYLDSWHILKVDPTGFSDPWEVGRERKKGLQTDFSPEQVEGCRCPHWDTESWEWSSFGGRGTKIQFQKCGVSDAVPEMKPGKLQGCIFNTPSGKRIQNYSTERNTPEQQSVFKLIIP